jgi:dTDP-4-amino-4,6-dideoxygalactose transaminase
MSKFKIPFNDLGKRSEDLVNQESVIVANVLKSGWFIHGPNVEKFEIEFASFLNAQYVVTVGNGTDALLIALKTLDVGIGDYVAIAPNAGFYAATAVLSLGAIPVYVDIDPQTYNMAVEDLARVLIEHEIKTVVFTSLYGNTSGLVEVSELLKIHNIPLIEDCAQSTGAMTLLGRSGSIATISTFSFYPTKNLAAIGDGGAISTNSKEHFESIKSIKQYGWDKNEKYRVLRLGQNSRMDEIQAAILNFRLQFLFQDNQKRVEIAIRYRDALPAEAGLIRIQNDGSHVAHLCVLESEHQKMLSNHLESHGVQTVVHYPILDVDQPVITSSKLNTREVPNAKKLAKMILSLPNSPTLSEPEVETVQIALQKIGF